MYFTLIQTRAFVDNDDLITRLQARYCPQADRHVTAFCKNLAFAVVDDNLENIDPVNQVTASMRSDESFLNLSLNQTLKGALASHG